MGAAARVFGHRESTITTWVSRAGEHMAVLHTHWLKGLHLPHVQLDELRTRLRVREHVLWLWVALDPCTKLIPVLHLGTRTQAAAHGVVHTLHEQLAPGCVPVFTSDGLNLYFYALTAHFGEWVWGLTEVGRRVRQWVVAVELVYGQVQKVYRRRRLVRVKHEMRCGSLEELRTRLLELGLSGRLNTAFVERVNLTIRQSIAALGRQSWATAQSAVGLMAHLEWWRGYYHFVRPHEGLRVEMAGRGTGREGGERRRYRGRTPAQAAGLTGHRWTVRELLAVPLPLPMPVGQLGWSKG